MSRGKAALTGKCGKCVYCKFDIRRNSSPEVHDASSQITEAQHLVNVLIYNFGPIVRLCTLENIFLKKLQVLLRLSVQNRTNEKPRKLLRSCR